jgi:hypothetical protein
MGNSVWGDEPSYGTGAYSTHATGGTETRPRNVAYLTCIYAGVPA